MDSAATPPDGRRRSAPPIVVLGLGALALIALVAAFLLTGGSGGLDRSAAPTDPYPDFDGVERSLADYRGRPLVVNFWASTCIPCVEEMPAFERVHQSREGEVAFVGLNVNDLIEDGLRLAEQTGVTYDLGRDPAGELLRAVEGIGMPTTVLVHPDGTMSRPHTGELSESELNTMIDEEFGL